MKTTNARPKDLGKNVDTAVKREVPKIEAARTFGVGISSLKRYAATNRDGMSLIPKMRPGRSPS